MLPLTILLDTALDTTSPPLVRNFAVIYAEMAFDRAAVADRLSVVCLLAYKVYVASCSDLHACALKVVGCTADCIMQVHMQVWCCWHAPE